VDDVLAVASFLQMQDIMTACHALKSLAEPANGSGENTEAIEGKFRLFLRGVQRTLVLFCVCVVLGIELRALQLLSRHSTT
jgi:hypothetical protein